MIAELELEQAMEIDLTIDVVATAKADDCVCYPGCCDECPPDCC